MSERGLIVAIYGMNNIGKSSVVEGVINKLGDNAFSLKYPIYDTPSGERLNKYLRNGNPENLTPIEAQKLFAQNRVDFEPELLRRSRGKCVVLEDYNGTGKAWGLITTGASIEEMEEINKGQLEPDLNILLDGDRFTSGIESNHRHESVGGDVWNKGREIHKELGKRYGWKTVRVCFGELDREIDEVVDLIQVAIERRGV